MKKTALLLTSVALFVLTACNSTYHAGNAAPDDVYYSSKNQPQPAKPASSYSNNNTNSYAPSNNYQYPENSNNSSNINTGNQYQTENNSGYQSAPANNYDNSSSHGYNNYSGDGNNSGYQNNSNAGYPTSGSANSYTTNNYYYSQDDYYDYAYSARLRRFYSPYTGYSYYDPVYTNSYWYDYNPYNWGVSIYSGYSWWAPSYYYYSPFIYTSGISIGLNFGWGVPCYTSWYYPSYYSPYTYGCGYYGGWGHHGWGHLGYYTGYNNGYWTGYNQGYTDGSWGLSNPYYYNSYDGNFHYGPRGGSVGGNSPRPNSSQGFGSGKVVSSVGDKYNLALDQGKITRPAVNVQSAPAGGRSMDNGFVRPSGGAGFIQDNASDRNNTNNNPSGGISRPSTYPTDVRNNPSNNGFDRGFSESGKNQNTQPANGNTFQEQQSGRNNSNAGYNNNQSSQPGNGNVFQGQQPGRVNMNSGFDQNRPQTRPQESTPSRGDQFNSGNGWNQSPTRSFDNQSQNPSNNYTAPAPSQQPGMTRDDNHGFFSRPNNDNNPIRSNDQWRNNDRSSPSFSNPPQRSFSSPQFERNSTRPSMEMPRNRDEQRTPTFQPRNEPKQFSQPGRRR